MTTATFRTPRGKLVALEYRDDTNDFNTLRSCLDEDEYQLADLRLTGTALDVGAHIGGVTIALAVDNPELHVIAVEPVRPNVELLRANVARAGVANRVVILPAAAGPGKRAVVNWNYRGDETADHHRFIGNSSLVKVAKNHDQDEVDARSLESLVGDGLSFAKVDCEGCEFELLAGPALARIERIHGEYHADPAPLVKALEATHDVELATTIPGGFVATRREPETSTASGGTGSWSFDLPATTPGEWKAYKPKRKKRDAGERPRRRKAAKK